MAEAIDTQSIIDRVSKKGAPSADEETAEGEPDPSVETDTADQHLGQAFDALTSGNRQGFIAAMKECLGEGY